MEVVTGESQPAADHILNVVCDDPRHARGRVAKVATFRRNVLPDGVWWMSARPLTSEVVYDSPQADGTYRSRRGRLKGDQPGGQTRYRHQCPLCPLALVATEDVLQWALESVYEHRNQLPNTGVAEGVSRVRLAALLTVVSSLPEHPAR